MVIKQGYSGEETKIRIGAENGNPGGAEFWIEQTGLKDPDSPHRTSETLAYISLTELIQLRDECNEAIKIMTGITD